MTKEILLLEREETIKPEFGSIKAWCILPDETFVCETVGIKRENYKKYAFVRWDMKENKILATSAYNGVMDHHTHEKRLFLLSNHRVLSFTTNIKGQVHVNEWNYETNTMLQRDRYITTDPTGRCIERIYQLRGDRFLIKLNIDCFVVYDAKDRSSFEFNQIDRYSASGNYLNWFFLEEKEGERLSFMWTDGHCLEGSCKETMEYYDAQHENKSEEEEEEEKQLVWFRGDPSIKNGFKPFTDHRIHLVHTLSNGDLLLIDYKGNIQCLDRTKKPAVSTIFQTMGIIGHYISNVLELKNGLILVRCSNNQRVVLWNRKGELLLDRNVPKFDSVLESNDGGLVFTREKTITKWYFTYSEGTLVNHCCNAISRFEEMNPNHYKDVINEEYAIVSRNMYFERFTRALPFELYELIRSFLEARSKRQTNQK